MVDGKHGNGNEAYLNIQTYTGPITNLVTMFEKVINSED